MPSWTRTPFGFAVVQFALVVLVVVVGTGIYGDPIRQSAITGVAVAAAVSLVRFVHRRRVVTYLK